MRFPNDSTVLWTAHAALIGLLATAVIRTLLARFRSAWLRRKRKRGVTGDVTGVVTRGEQSMGMLAAGFATTFGLFVFMIEVSNAATGYKSVLVLADFMVLLYLFFFNGWFRNWAIGRFSARRADPK